MPCQEGPVWESHYLFFKVRWVFADLKWVNQASRFTVFEIWRQKGTSGEGVPKLVSTGALGVLTLSSHRDVQVGNWGRPVTRKSGVWLIIHLKQISQSMRRGSLVEVNYCSVTKACLTLCDPMDCSMPGLPVPHHLPECTQVHVHWISDALQLSHHLSPSSPSACNLSQHQSLFQTVGFSHQVAKVLGLQF